MRYVLAQDGSFGWRRAHEREVINGCAADVIGDVDWSVGGRVFLFGNKIGEMKGLDMLAPESAKIKQRLTGIGVAPFQQDYPQSQLALAKEGGLGSPEASLECTVARISSLSCQIAPENNPYQKRTHAEAVRM